MANCKDYITISSPTQQTPAVEVEGISPIEVERREIGDTLKFIISSNLSEPQQGDPGEAASIDIGSVQEGDHIEVTNSGTSQHAIFNFLIPRGKKGDKGDSITGNQGPAGTLEIRNVTSGDTPKITNVGTSQAAILDITLPKGDKGDVGKDGLAKGISEYKISVGNNSGENYSMSNFGQGTYVDLGDNPTSLIRKVKIHAWVTVANMQNWTTLKLTRGSNPSYNNATPIKVRVKHSEGENYIGEWEIDAYIETTDRYIGFTFADNVGGMFSSDGSQYGDYGVEVFILT